MNKIASVIFCLLLAGSMLVGCGTANTSGLLKNTNESGQASPSEADAGTIQPEEAVNVDETEAGNTLVVYYSATGNTEKAGRQIAEFINADIFALEPVQPYTAEDLNWYDKECRTVQEYEDLENVDVELVSYTADNWDAYDTVFVGYPIWAEIAAWPVNGFVKANDFTGKTVIPFCTSWSSGIGESAALLEEMTNTGKWQEGMRFDESGDYSSRIAEWLMELNLEGYPAGADDIPVESLSDTTDISLMVGNVVITATLDNSETAQEFLASLPRTLTMHHYGGREYYGRIEEISKNGEAIPDFENGDVAYLPSGPYLAVFFAGEDESDLAGLIRMGKITSDLSVFETFGDSIEMTIEVMEGLEP